MEKETNEKTNNGRIKVSLTQLIFIILFVIAIILVAIQVFNKSNNTFNLFNNNGRKVKFANTTDTIKEENLNIEIVPSLLDDINYNSVWCAPFQLVWNDMQNKVVKEDIIFTPQLKIADNLNKQTFTEKDLSEDYYYKTYGLKTYDLRDKIKKGIKDKFDQTSNILDMIDWTNTPQDESYYTDKNFKEYLFYCMLYREFNFKNDFDVLDNSSFIDSNNKWYENVKYFGIDEYEKKLGDQIKVLYYNSKKDFAIILDTIEGDEIILTKGNNQKNFGSIYNNVIEKASNYSGNKEFTKDDYFKMVNLNINITKEFDELYNKMFISKEGNECEIKQAIQSIEMELNKSGGKVKSEAAITLMKFEAAIRDNVEERFFYLDDTFTIFIREKGKGLPYFAANVDNIELFQN